ncbi:MAG: AbrB family transcriptional regulator [Rhizobiales bacterium]|nr:AbrB family transcriptional regulator [Hyphomicrobiales bacterium]
MKVSKWGNSLAVRLSAETVTQLGVKEGDDVDVSAGFREGTIEIRRKRTKEELRERLAEIRKRVKVPDDYKFDRDEANSRGE